MVVLSRQTLAILALFAACIGLAPLAAQDRKRAPDSADEWIPLFNGKDFTGWKIPNPPSNSFKSVKEVTNDAGKVTAFVGVTKDGKDVTLWQIKDGLIVGGGPASHIFTDIEADNFHYRVEAMVNDKGNSGQYFRTAFGPGFPKGYEAQLNATHGDKIKTGSLYPSFGKLTDADREKMLVLNTAAHKPGEFFTQEVIADGNRIRILVNGKQTIDFTDSNNTFTKGHFALQGHDPGSVMTFKKVEYKPIKK